MTIVRCYLSFFPFIRNGSMSRYENDIKIVMCKRKNACNLLKSDSQSDMQSERQTDSLVEQHGQHHLIGLFWQIVEEQDVVGRVVGNLTTAQRHQQRNDESFFLIIIIIITPPPPSPSPGLQLDSRELPRPADKKKQGIKSQHEEWITLAKSDLV